VPKLPHWFKRLETTKYIKGRDRPILTLKSKEVALNKAIDDAKLDEAQAVKVRNAVSRLDVLFESQPSEEISEIPLSRFSSTSTDTELSDLTEDELNKLQAALADLEFPEEKKLARGIIGDWFTEFTEHSIDKYINYLGQLLDQKLRA
jgi:hypothetical protein